MSIALGYFTKKFVPKTKDCKILKNKIEHVVQDITLVWKKSFGLLALTIEEEKEEEATQVELDNKEDFDELDNLQEVIRRKVEESEQKNVVTIEDIPKETQQNVNVLIEANLKNDAVIKTTSNTPLPCINPVLIQIHDYPRSESAPTMDSTLFHSTIIVDKKGQQDVSFKEQGKIMIILLHPTPTTNRVIKKEELEEK